MKETKQEAPDIVPSVTKDQLAKLKAQLAAGRREPVLSTGTVTVCPNCGGRMITTNDLERAIATPGLVYVIARLPGARCEDCESVELDGSGVAILSALAPQEIIANYETTVTHSSGTTLGTYFKMDLSRVLGLLGNERLCWKVVDRDNVLVQVQRGQRQETSRHGKVIPAGLPTREDPKASGRRGRKARIQV
jgi:hypothetical protein